MAPDEFVPAAERSGLIDEIGEWVMGQALAQVRRWRQSRPGITISVNLSRHQLTDPTLPQRLRERLREGGIDPSVLWLEVSESAIAADPDAAAAALTALRELGVGLAIDDVGRRAGSERLRDMPVEMLKLDRSVVARLDGSSSADEALVETVVELGHTLGLSVVAEGVETDHQLALVRDLGCDGAQGYLFSRPVPEDSVRELLGVA